MQMSKDIWRVHKCLGSWDSKHQDWVQVWSGDHPPTEEALRGLRGVSALLLDQIDNTITEIESLSSHYFVSRSSTEDKLTDDQKADLDFAVEAYLVFAVEAHQACYPLLELGEESPVFRTSKLQLMFPTSKRQFNKRLSRMRKTLKYEGEDYPEGSYFYWEWKCIDGPTRGGFRLDLNPGRDKL